MLALPGSFAQLATFSAVARIVCYMATCAAVPVLRRKVVAPADAFELPGGVVIPALALVVSAMILANASWVDLRGGGLALVIGAVLYFLAKAGSRREREGAR